jgi:hypothetical protein
MLVFVINYGKGRTKKDDGPAVAIDNDVTSKAEHLFARHCNLLPLAEPGADVQLTRAGTELVDGIETLVVRARSEQIGEIEFSFAAQSGLYVRCKQALPGTDPSKPQFNETLLSDYKDVQGAPLPMRITAKQAGRAFLDITIVDASFAEGFDEDTFAKP